MSLKFFHMTSTQLPLFAHVGNSSRRKFCSHRTFVLWYAGTSRFSWVTKPFNTHKHIPIPGMLVSSKSREVRPRYFRVPFFISKGAYTPTDSSPIQSSQTHKDAAVTLWLIYNGRRGSAYTPAESSRVPRVLPSQKSWCRMFHFRQSDSSDWAWRKKWM
jgi:hypothetical protein